MFHIKKKNLCDVLTSFLFQNYPLIILFTLFKYFDKQIWNIKMDDYVIKKISEHDIEAKLFNNYLFKGAILSMFNGPVRSGTKPAH